MTALDNQMDNPKTVFDQVFVAGQYDDLIGRLIKDYKFNSVRALADVLVDILDGILPLFNEDIIIVPLPTISSHIRQRGFDHIAVLAKKIAKRRRWQLSKCLVRNKNSVQVGADKNTRKRQAKVAYKLVGEIDKNNCYVLLDDVWTTGASMEEAGKIMRRGGAVKLLGVVLSVNRSKDKRSCIRRTAAKRIKNEVDNSIR